MVNNVEPENAITSSSNSEERSPNKRTARKKKAPVTTTLIMVRHGKTPTTGKILPGRAPGLHLSEDGVADARAIAQRIFEAFPSPDAIVSSPMERALETSEPLSTLTGIPVLKRQEILECDFGEWTGRELSELSKLEQWRTVQQRPSLFRFPNGESFVEMSDRMRSFMLDIDANYRGKVVVAYSHADPIKALIADCLGMHLDQFQRIVIATTSVSTICITEGVPYVTGVNVTSKLSKGMA